MGEGYDIRTDIKGDPSKQQAGKDGATHLLKWDADSQVFGPAAGFVRANTADPKDATILFMSGVAADGTAIQQELFEKNIKGTIVSVDASGVGDQYIHFEIVGRALNGPDVDFTVTLLADNNSLNFVTGQDIGATFDLIQDIAGLSQNPWVVDQDVGGKCLINPLAGGEICGKAGDGIVDGLFRLFSTVNTALSRSITFAKVSSNWVVKVTSSGLVFEAENAGLPINLIAGLTSYTASELGFSNDNGASLGLPNAYHGDFFIDGDFIPNNIKDNYHVVPIGGGTTLGFAGVDFSLAYRQIIIEASASEEIYKLNHINNHVLRTGNGNIKIVSNIEIMNSEGFVLKYSAAQGGTIDVIKGEEFNNKYTMAANAVDGDVVNWAGKDYTYRTVINDGIDAEVTIGATSDDSVNNMLAATTLGAGAGTLYSTATTAIPANGRAIRNQTDLTMIRMRVMFATTQTASTTVTGATIDANSISNPVTINDINGSGLTNLREYELVLVTTDVWNLSGIIGEANKTTLLQNSDVTHGNSAATVSLIAANVGSKTIPAHLLKADTQLNLRGHGYISNGIGGSNETLTVDIVIGGVNIGTITMALATNITNVHFEYDINVFIRTAGAGGAVVCSGFLAVNGDTTFGIVKVGTTAIDLDANKVIDINGTWSAAEADATVTTQMTKIQAVNSVT